MKPTRRKKEEKRRREEKWVGAVSAVVPYVRSGGGGGASAVRFIFYKKFGCLSVCLSLLRRFFLVGRGLHS